MMYNSLTTNEPLWFFYYLTHWGVILTMFSVWATYRASHQKQWQTTAMISTQCATGLNLLIMVCFWCLLAPYIFPNLGWTGHDLYMRIHMITLHFIPFIQTTVNTMITDIKMVQEDWPFMMFLGVFYMFANWLGRLDTGVAIYPVVDWEDPVFSVAGWTFLASVMSVLYYFWAKFHNSVRSYLFGK